MPDPLLNIEGASEKAVLTKRPHLLGPWAMRSRPSFMVRDESSRLFRHSIRVSFFGFVQPPEQVRCNDRLTRTGWRGRSSTLTVNE
jgi:hypothetical protein